MVSKLPYATAAERNDLWFIGNGIGMRWLSVNEDISVETLM